MGDHAEARLRLDPVGARAAAVAGPARAQPRGQGAPPRLPGDAPAGHLPPRVARDAAFKALGNLTPSFAVDTDGVRVYVDTADQEISRLVYIFGLYDKPLMTLAFSALAQVGGPASLEGKRLLDLGANIGTTTLNAVANLRAEGAYCFEPDPANFRNLEVNIAANGLRERVAAFPVALSDVTGKASLARSPDNAGDHRVVADGVADGEVIEVEAARLDDLVEAGEVDLDRVGVAARRPGTRGPAARRRREAARAGDPRGRRVLAGRAPRRRRARAVRRARLGCLHPVRGSGRARRRSSRRGPADRRARVRRGAARRARRAHRPAALAQERPVRPVGAWRDPAKSEFSTIPRTARK